MPKVKTNEVLSVTTVDDLREARRTLDLVIKHLEESNIVDTDYCVKQLQEVIDTATWDINILSRQ